jgi:hypothetical protein
MTILARAETSGAYRWMWVAKPEFQIGNSLGTPGCFRKCGKYRTYGSDFRVLLLRVLPPRWVLDRYQEKRVARRGFCRKNFLLAHPKSASAIVVFTNGDTGRRNASFAR